MKDSSFFRRIGPVRSYVVGETFAVYLAQGMALILLGSVLPSIREAYGLDYTVGGALLSVQSIGFLLAGLVTGALTLRVGLKRAYLLFYTLCPVGLLLLLTGRSPAPALAAMLLIGLTKGAVTDYNNRIVSNYSGADASPLNLLHAFFAIGACIAPLLALICTHLAGSRGWRAALWTAAALAGITLVTGLFMRIDDAADAARRPARAADAFGFLREPLFRRTVAIGILYQAIEASFMGWLTSFFLASGSMGQTSAQLVTSALWVSLLIGRFFCAGIARKYRPWQMILVMCWGMAASLAVLLAARPVWLMLAATVALGLCMSGMYGTSVSNAGDVFARYPIAMGLYVTIIGAGAVAAPALVGVFSDLWGMRRGMCVLLVCAAGLLAAACANASAFRRGERAA